MRLVVFVVLVAVCIRDSVAVSGFMQESKTASVRKEQERQMGIMDRGENVDIRQPSINTEPRTLNDMKMECAMVTAQKIYAEHPFEDFTKDAVDTATRENAPAEDANSLGKQLDDLVQKAGDVIETDFTQSKASVPTVAPPTQPSAPAM
ncbi:hypothetical protein KC19_10G169800 [Ceratodon purpureus]|uniref:Uncharacterized protein n=1 Tax=Ceratodon purpureus TaxID=3225 RepID=A0A8T0GNY3_CERPU|nr:hypothetical protein KC19_10G169800 [Ceratodon purpureus]